MSRIDEADRGTQRAAEQLAIRKKREEQRARERQQPEAGFATLLRKSQPRPDSRGQSPVVAQAQAQGTGEPERGPGTVSRDGDAKRGAPMPATRMPSGPCASPSLQTVQPARDEDAKAGREPQDAQSEAHARPTKGSPLEGTVVDREGDVRADANGDGDRRSGSNREDRDQSPSHPGSGFRLNPALMSPIPVAKKNETSRSERLRRLAAEIAQRIVERVRVGTDASGIPEFQIDLRRDVLMGLSIRISGGGGVIRASFSGTDREALRLLRDHTEDLKQALGSRGLTLGELRIEDRP
jgi:hypothetical protein